MDKTQLRPVVSLGMFDLIKGVAILTVIYGHSIIDFDHNPHPVFSSLASALLYCFVIVIGYGLRKRPMRKCLKQQFNTYLRPYFLTGVGAALMLCIVNYLLFRGARVAVTEALSLFAGAALGQYPTTEYFGFTVYSCGPMWFIVAIVIGTIILNAILNLTGGKRKITAALAAFVGIIGVVIGPKAIIPFCFFQALTFVPGLYLGMITKELKLLEKKPNFPSIIIAVVSLFCVLYKKDGNSLGLAMLYFPLSFVSLAACCFFSLSLVYIFTHINRRSNFIVNALEWVGHNSIYILCLHGVEYAGACWYHCLTCFESRPYLGLASILLARCLFIALGMLVIRVFKKCKGAMAV